MESWYMAIGSWGQQQEGRNEGMSDPWRWDPGGFISERGLSLPAPLCHGAKGLPKFRSMVEAGEGDGVG